MVPVTTLETPILWNIRWQSWNKGANYIWLHNENIIPVKLYSILNYHFTIFSSFLSPKLAQFSIIISKFSIIIFFPELAQFTNIIFSIFNLFLLPRVGLILNYHFTIFNQFSLPRVGSNLNSQFNCIAPSWPNSPLSFHNF